MSLGSMMHFEGEVLHFSSPRVESPKLIPGGEPPLQPLAYSLMHPLHLHGIRSCKASFERIGTLHSLREI